MKFNHLLALAFWPFVSAVKTKPFCPPRHASNIQQRAILDNWVQEFLIEKNMSRAFLDHVTEDYISHNPFARRGRQNAIDYLETYFPLSNYTVMHVAVSDSTGWVHYKQTTAGQPDKAIVDIFRMNGTCIMEHWDVIESMPANATNPIALF